MSGKLRRAVRRRAARHKQYVCQRSEKSGERFSAGSIESVTKGFRRRKGFRPRLVRQNAGRFTRKNRDASSQVAHAISTHKTGVEFDFFTAVDDLKPEDTAGSDHLGTVEFNSACFYRYANVNVEKLKENLQGDEDLTRATIEAFIRAAVEAIPTGKQNSFATHEKPSFVLAVVSDAGKCSLANAFEKAVKAEEWDEETKRTRDGLVRNSIERLAEHYGKVTKVFGDNAKSKVFVKTNNAETNGLGTQAETFSELIDKTIGAIFGEKEA